MEFFMDGSSFTQSSDQQVGYAVITSETTVEAQLLPAWRLTDPACFIRMKPSVFKEGDLIIGGFFPLYTFITYDGSTKPSKEVYMKQFETKNYQYVLALTFAIEEINRNPHLLPNITLGFDLYNSLHSEQTTLENPIIWQSGLDKDLPNYTCRKETKSIAALTGTTWAVSAQIGTLLELYKIPQLAYGLYDPQLSDDGQFSSLYQITPKDTTLALGMVSLMLHFSWNWVGLVISEDKRGVNFLLDLREEMDKKGVCAGFLEMIPVTERSYYSKDWQYHLRIRKSTVNVTLIYGDSDSLMGLSFWRWRLLVIGKVCITTSQWDFTTSERDFLLDSFHGALIFSQNIGKLPDFKTFIQTVKPSKYPEDFYLTKLWYVSFDCSVSESDCNSLENCPPNASLELLPWWLFDKNMKEGSYNVYNAVYAVAQSLHEMLLQRIEMQSVENGDGLGVYPWQLHPFLKNIQFNNSAGDPVILDKERKFEARYDILNFWNFPEGFGHKVKVGHFNSDVPRDQQLSLSEEMIEWATGFSETPHSVCSKKCLPGFRKTFQEGKAACCFLCTSCPENEISNDTDMDECVKCADHQYANSERNQYLQKTATFLAYGDPLGMALVCTALCFSFLTTVILGVFLKHRDTPIVKANNRILSYILLISLTLCFLCSLLFTGCPNTAICILQQITFGIVFTVAVSTVLAKTITVVLAFKVTAPGRRMRQYLVSGAPNFVIPICSLIQMALCGIWLGTSPIFIDKDAHSEPGYIIIECNKGSATAFYCVLGCLGCLALGSFTVAFLARNLPDTFNEAKFLTFSMLVFCSVWVTFLPVYHSTKGKIMAAVEIFSILASSAGLLGCIFAPKCYIIFLNPDRNTHQGLRYQTHSRGNKSS
ncbi:vomeronasal type-2 receptor 116-like [Dasypus novemcinctus]|uniref:vomeronasal type-2 receptor 116-like n=1 Tax=Dasypus novemcinctus TaxID=9361 RepID=UPI0039C9D3F3